MDRIVRCENVMQKLFNMPPNKGEGKDPELMQILQRLIFGEVFFIGTLDEKTRELLTCVGLATMQTLPQLTAHANAALNVGIAPLTLREAVYTLMPLIGCPKTLNAVVTLDGVFEARGISLPLEAASTVKENDRFEAGKKYQFPVYGDEIKDNFSFLPKEFAEALPRILTEYGFGDFYTRKGLDAKTRELVELTALIALGGCEKQIKPHIAGCYKVGYTKEDVCSAILQLLPYTGVPRSFNAMYVLKEIGC